MIIAFAGKGGVGKSTISSQVIKRLAEKELVLAVDADPNSNLGDKLGIQVFGPGAVDKMVDIAVMGISMGAVLEDFENLDFAYAPPFSTAISRSTSPPRSCRPCPKGTTSTCWSWAGPRARAATATSTTY